MIIAGPCSIESKEQFLGTVKFLEDQGVEYIRGGFKKYRSDPATFQGAGLEALSWIQEAKSKYGIKYVGEVFTSEDILLFGQAIDVFQVGSRNMHNTSLLKALNQYASIHKKPVILKRHYAASITEFVRHSEYLTGCEVWLCLRGTMSLWPNEQRFMPDATDIPRLKKLTDKKIIWDPSHAGCQREYVPGLAAIGKMLGADGFIVEVHHDPPNSFSDADQALSFDDFIKMKREII